MIRSPPVDSRVRIRLRQCAVFGASLWYRATPSGASNRRCHLVSLGCKCAKENLAAAVGVEPTNAWFRARCLGPLGDAASFGKPHGDRTRLTRLKVWGPHQKSSGSSWRKRGRVERPRPRCRGSRRFQGGHRRQSVCASIIRRYSNAANGGVRFGARRPIRSRCLSAAYQTKRCEPDPTFDAPRLYSDATT